MIHTFRHFLLLSHHVFPDLVDFAFSFKLDSFSFLDRLGEAFTGDFFTCTQLCLLLLDVAQLRVEHIVVLPLLLLQIDQICLHFGISLLCELSLEHEAAFGGLVEEVRAVSKAIVAELLGDALRVWTLGTLLDEVIKEAEDLEVETLKTIILIIVKLLSNSVIIAL